MHPIKTVARSIYRFFLLWIVDAVSLLLTAAIFPGVAIATVGTTSRLEVTIAAAFLLGIVNLLIRPLILLLAVPLGFFGVFIVGFFVNAIALQITASLLPGLTIEGWLAAILAGIIFSAINTIITSIMEIDDEGSFYQGLVERLARRQPFAGAEEPGRGLVMMEIDGLSYHHIKKALAVGKLPTLKRMIEEEGYVLSRVDCGIPSQTSACQAGIMFGDNHDIPAFRWYDKDQQKLYVSGSDAAEINARYANGKGLMRGGSSIDNMMNGDAEKSLLTLADLRGADKVQKRRRADDIYLLMLNPYFFMRTIVLLFGEVGRELWQAWQQKRKNVWPRLNRLEHFYPFVRAATTVFVRDIAAHLTVLDIIRGAPSIYVTWPGYDEVAHHSGPWTKDAFGVLAKYDSVIERVRTTIRDKAPRPYDLIILSDHGQSFGATFKQRYGVTLKEFIERLLPQGTTVAQSMGGDTGIGSLTAVSGELENVQQQGVGGRAGRAVARQGQQLLDKGAERREAGQALQPAQVTAYGSGNLAQVYFDLYPRKVTLTELNTAFPGMVDALVQHEGIGMVCGYDDDGVPLVLGKQGTRNLHSGEIIGQDPLELYAPSDPAAYGAATVETRAWQVRRVMDFPHAGDLMVISTVYPDGTVAALEELIGNHGGLGGEQTDAFIFHPPDMEVPETRNAVDVFDILNGRRGQSVEAAGVTPEAAPVEGPGPWSIGNLWRGLKDVRTWGALALRSLVLDRSAYRDVARDPVMTGPGLVIGLAMTALSAAMRVDQAPLAAALAATLLWPVSVLAMFAAGRLLSGKGEYTRTLRAIGFGESAYIIELLAFIPTLAPLVRIVAGLTVFLATWMAAAEAHETRGWRTLVFPLVNLVIVILVPLALVFLISGAAFTVQALLQNLGIVAG